MCEILKDYYFILFYFIVMCEVIGITVFFGGGVETILLINIYG